MKTTVKASTIVKPATATAATAVWLSDMDLIMGENVHFPNRYIYPYTGGHHFFDTVVLKNSLSQALVEFYPLAGRLEEVNGRIQINCNDEGALFVEADCDAALLDFTHFIPPPDINLVPKVDYSRGISSFPLLVVQVTRFKCGGVCIGAAAEHFTADGFSVGLIMNAWAEIARGHQLTTKPFLDRRLLSARDPPQPRFPHVEYLPPPAMKKPKHNSQIVFKMLKLTPDQLNALQSNCQGGGTDNVKYTTFEKLAGHVWRCLIKARGLPKDQETQLYVPVNGRSMLRPPLPQGYFGNVVFKATTRALCGELESNPLEFAVRKIHEAVAGMSNDYMRSAVDYLELNRRKVEACARGTAAFECPNVGVVNATRLDFSSIDFGWGNPIHVGFDGVPPEGTIYVMPCPISEGSLFLAIALPKEQMQVFESLCCEPEFHANHKSVQLRSRH